MSVANVCWFCGIRQCMCDWLDFVTNAACAEKPDHVRRNAVNALQVAAPSVVSAALSRWRVDDGWNSLALRSALFLFRVTGITRIVDQGQITLSA